MFTKTKEKKDTEDEFYSEEATTKKRINFNDLINKVKEEKKMDFRSNIIIISGVVVAVIIVLMILAF